MAVSYKRLLHFMIEKDITNVKLMKDANVSVNIIKKIKTRKYIAFDKVESICMVLEVMPNDILEFIQLEDGEDA